MNKVLKYSANWCNPCKQMDTQIERLGLVVEHVDIEVDKDAAKTYSLRSIPTLIKFSESGEEIGRSVGSLTDAKLIEFLK